MIILIIKIIMIMKYLMMMMIPTLKIWRQGRDGRSEIAQEAVRRCNEEAWIWTNHDLMMIIIMRMMVIKETRTNYDDDDDYDEAWSWNNDDHDDDAVKMKKSPEGRGVELLLDVGPPRSPPIIICIFYNCHSLFSFFATKKEDYLDYIHAHIDYFSITMSTKREILFLILEWLSKFTFLSIEVKNITKSNHNPQIILN